MEEAGARGNGADIINCILREKRKQKGMKTSGNLQQKSCLPSTLFPFYWQKLPFFWRLPFPLSMWFWWGCLFSVPLPRQTCDTELARVLTLLVTMPVPKMDMWAKTEGTSWNFKYKCHEKENLSCELTSWEGESLKLSNTISPNVSVSPSSGYMKEVSLQHTQKNKALKWRIRIRDY